MCCTATDRCTRLYPLARPVEFRILEINHFRFTGHCSIWIYCCVYNNAIKLHCCYNRDFPFKLLVNWFTATDWPEVYQKFTRSVPEVDQISIRYWPILYQNVTRALPNLDSHWPEYYQIVTRHACSLVKIWYSIGANLHNWDVPEVYQACTNNLPEALWWS